MIAEDQSRTIAFLRDPASYGMTAPVEVIETHISMIFLAGDRAYKLKRAVKLPYVDFSTRQLRAAVCAKEVDLNRRTAPELYLGLSEIVRGKDGRLAFGGPGEAIDMVVEMMRFGQEGLFDRLAATGGLTPRLMDGAADMIAAFHRDAPPVHSAGGAANMEAVLSINEAGFATSHIFAFAELAAFNAAFRARLQTHRALLDERERDGRVRRCHGDLHLRNICLFEGRPQLFDCIEFDDRLATIDVLYDLAFLLMDLWHRNLPELANRVMNRYLDATHDDGGFALLPFFMAVRAAVRAHVTATQAEEGAGDKEKLASQARGSFELAKRLLETSAQRLVAIGGLSGSGKSTVAEALAPLIGPPPGARIFETDRIRKAMHGVAPEVRLPPEAYAPEISVKVYTELASRAFSVLSEGGTAVVDGVFDRDDNRRLVERAADEAGVPFTGIWLEADAETLRNRVGRRLGGPSDADLSVLEQQLRGDHGSIAWERFDAREDAAGLARKILSCPLAITPPARESGRAAPRPPHRKPG